MWRSEERLEFWLAGGKPSPQTRRSVWLESVRLRRYTGTVKELPLGIQSGTVSLDDSLPAEANVKDGLGMLSDESAARIGSPASPPATATTHSVNLMSAAVVRKISMPDGQRTRIRQEKLVIEASARSGAAEIALPEIRGPEMLREGKSSVEDGTPLLLQDPAIRTTERISELPHRRESADIGRLSDSERKSFLREAEVLKHIPSGGAELLAVFRHVPIELISRLRFVAESREIRFSISTGPKRTSTRVHDLAAVRDFASQEIHLVPHRTRFRPVSLI